MKLQLRKNRKGGFTLIELMVVIAILAALASVGYGPIMEHMGDGDRQAAQSNLKNLHSMLLTFNQDNNSYPCDETAERLMEDYPDYNFGELTGEKSNCYFRQLFFKGNPDEKLFYAKVTGCKEPDGKFANGAALEKGENAFAYVLRKPTEESEGKRISVSNRGTIPLAFSCVASSRAAYSGEAVNFDTDSFRGHAFVLKSDGSVTDMAKTPGFANDEEGVSKPNAALFPESKKGEDTSKRYVVLPPDL